MTTRSGPIRGIITRYDFSAEGVMGSPCDAGDMIDLRPGDDFVPYATYLPEPCFVERTPVLLLTTV